jgi:hypothetical protein
MLTQKFLSRHIGALTYSASYLAIFQGVGDCKWGKPNHLPWEQCTLLYKFSMGISIGSRKCSILESKPSSEECNYWMLMRSIQIGNR